MAIPSVKIHSATPGVRQPVSHRSNGPSKRVDLTLPNAGYQALFDGFVAWGQGIRAFGQAMGGANQRMEGAALQNAKERVVAQSQGRDPVLVSEKAAWWAN